ncbi:MAG TPA: YncE family protein [Candidatus Dormibacteraeota bacterium]|nr:YncE family protein [Candidatus Dormibacteraeota bacterium]
MKWQSISTRIGFAAAVLGLTLAGCGSKTPTNQVIVSVSPSGGTLVLAQSFPFTATVSGSTDTSVLWTCNYTYTTTTLDANGVPTSTTTKPVACPSDNSWGQITDPKQNTVTYTAPSKLPTITPAPATGAFITAYTVVLTATSNADKKKSGSANITLDSGIRLTITPLTATLAVGKDTQKFTATAPNETQALNWFVTQRPSTLPTGTAFNPTPASAPCAAATCGTVDPLTGIYTPPATLPTDKTVYVVVNSKTDTTRYAFATITLTTVPSGPVTFSGISPDKAPWGGQIQDIYLIGNNLRSSTPITFNGTPVTPSQIAVVPLPASFCTPSTTVTCPNNSIITRLRLNAANLSAISSPGDVQITVTTNGGPVSQTLHLVQTKPVIAGTRPDSFPQGATFNPSTNTFTIDGGYFGTGASQAVKVTLNGSNMAIIPSSSSRQLTLNLQNTTIPAPGLYPVDVISNPSVKPSFVPLAATNLAIQPTSFGIAQTNIPLKTANAYPTAIAVDSSLGFAAVTESGANQVEIFDLRSGQPVSVATVAVGSKPTGIAIDTNYAVSGQDLAVVANNGDDTLSFIEIPSGRNLATLDLKNLIQPSQGSATTPNPYAVGIDPFSHLALVAFNDSNVGFIVQLTGPSGNCLTGHPPVAGTSYCPIASASIATGATPQVAFQPQLHVAYVSPGGRGSFSIVDLSQKSTSANIAPAPAGAVRSNNIVTITTVTPHGIDPIQGGSVLISGLPLGPKGTSFNGAFQVFGNGVVDSRTFQFSQSAADDTGGSSATVMGVVGVSGSSQPLGITSTAVGIAINPITRAAAYADPNATSSQIGFINSLDQVLAGSITLSVGSFGTTTGGAPEAGARFVAYQPYYNVAVSFNPARNEISFLDPAGFKRIVAAAPTGQVAIPTGTGAPTNVFGALAVDPQRNLVLIANAGSNTLTSINITTGPQQAVQIDHIETTLPGYGVPNSFLAQATLSATSTPPPVATAAGGYRFRLLGKGFATATNLRLRLDQVPITSFIVVSDQEIDFNIPATAADPLAPSQQFPRIFAVDVVSDTGNSNVTHLTVVGAADLRANCGTGTTPQPSAVAIDEQRDIALVTNPGCAVAGTNGTTAISNAGTVSIIDINPLNTATYGTVIRTVAVGVTPTGIAVIPRLGYAAVTNQGSATVTGGTVSVIDYHVAANPNAVALTPTKIADVTVGTAPSGIAINQDTGIIVVANTGDNTVSTIDLTVLQQSPAGKLTANRVAVDSTPMAVAIDPARQIAVVTALQFNGIGQSTFGVLDVIDLSLAVPVKNSSKTISGLAALPTGLAFDPVAALFYTTSSLSNAVYAFNPDTGQSSQIRVGENPTSIAYNPNSGELLTVNSRSNTISVVDTQTFQTVASLGIGSQSQFAAAMHPRTNLAVIADQANNRVLLLPLPK